MTLDEAISAACDAVSIARPKSYRLGKWSRTNTRSRHGKGDGSVMVEEDRATAFNWQTGEKQTVWLNGERSEEDRRKSARVHAERQREQRQQADRASGIAQQIVAAAQLSTHPYLIGKGFRDERVMTVGADVVQRLTGGNYAIAGNRAIVVAARRDEQVTTVQLIWEDGTKKFIFGGAVDGASHRIGTGVDTWLCEGLATGLSLRAALHGLRIKATILCCFSAANVAAVARRSSGRGRTFIAADNDKPMPQFDNLGTGEHYARQTGFPYGMPPTVRTDFNDMHQEAGIFAVQRGLTKIMAARRVA